MSRRKNRGRRAGAKYLHVFFDITKVLRVKTNGSKQSPSRTCENGFFFRSKRSWLVNLPLPNVLPP